MAEKRIKNINRFLRRRSNERGAQLVELAIVLPIFLMLFGAAAEFGNYFYTYNTLAKATRVAARYLSSRPFDDTEKAIAKNLAVCGSTASCASGTSVLSGLTTSNIQITSTGNAIQPSTITVAITSYSYSPVFDLSRWTGGTAWTNVAVTPSTTMRYLVWR